MLYERMVHSDKDKVSLLFNISLKTLTLQPTQEENITSLSGDGYI